MLHRLLPGHLKLQENMIIRTAYQNTGLFHADFLYQLEILLTGTYPAGNLREFIASLHTFVHGIPVLLAVQTSGHGTLSECYQGMSGGRDQSTVSFGGYYQS